MLTLRPAGVSCMEGASTSPGVMNRSCAGSGVKVAFVASTGLAGAWAVPLLVMNAKFTGSTPTEFRHAVLLFTPAGFELQLSMFRAAHHCLAAQLTPGGQDTQPGG